MYELLDKWIVTIGYSTPEERDVVIWAKDGSEAFAVATRRYPREFVRVRGKAII